MISSFMDGGSVGDVAHSESGLPIQAVYSPAALAGFDPGAELGVRAAVVSGGVYQPRDSS
jgi:hypothetical protein